MKFAEANGCRDCVSLAYQMFPKLNWAEFCAAFGESKQIRSSWELGSKIASGEVSQPWNIRGSIQEESSIGVLLEKKFLALTAEECMALFSVPADSIEGVKSITLVNEENESQLFYLFHDDLSYRYATFFSRHSVCNFSHLLEKEKMLRKEQPAERYSVLCKDDVSSRRGLSLMSLSAAKAKAQLVIENRMKQEEHEAENGEKPGESTFVPELEGMMEGIDKVELSAQPSGNDKGKKRKGGPPKSPTVPKRKARATKPARASSPTPSGALSATHGTEKQDKESLGGDVGAPDAAIDELATQIAAKIKTNINSVYSINVIAALNGAQLGRSLAGVFCLHWHWRISIFEGLGRAGIWSCTELLPL